MKKTLYLFTLVFAGAVIAALGVGANVSNAATASAAPTPTPAAMPSGTQPVITAAVTPTPLPLNGDEVIKIDTELVNISVRVIDRNNRSINGLQQGDFKVLEDGKPQQIDFFSKGEVPTNYGLVIDNSGSMRQQLDKVIEAGKVLIGTNRPDDETLVIRFVGRDNIEIAQPFTSSKADLNDALDNLYIQGGQTAIIDAVYLAVENIDQYEKAKGPNDRKRRALVLVSDGEDRNSYYNEKQLFELLKESEVQIYVIGFTDDLASSGGFISKSPQDKAKAFLTRMATETGGKAYFPASPSELPSLAQEISNELRTQYSIGYIPSNDARDGTFRSIKVVVNDGPKGEKRIAVTRAGRTAEGGSPQQMAPKPANAKP